MSAPSIARTRRATFSGFTSSSRSASAPDLEVEPPHVVGLGVQQRRAPAVERRVEPEPALGRPLHLHLDVADQELVVEHAALEAEPHQPAHGGARAVGGDHPVGADPIGALRRGNRQQHAVGGLLEALHLLLPAQVDQPRPRRRLDAGVLEVVLLQVDEGRPPMPRLGQQVEAVDLALVEEHLARLPGHALVDQRLAQPVPQPIPNAIHDLERALGPADRPAAVRQVRLPVDDDAAMALARQVERRHEPHRPRPDDDDGMMRRLARPPDRPTADKETRSAGRRSWVVAECRGPAAGGCPSKRNHASRINRHYTCFAPLQRLP